MISRRKWQWAGYVLNALIAALLIFAGSMKVFFSSPEMVKQLTDIGLGDQIKLIGCGELACAILLLLPGLSPWGILLTSGFWGGVICISMAHHQSYVLGSVLLALTWLGGFLRGSIPVWVSLRNPNLTP